MNSTTTQWQHLGPNPKSAYKQLFVNGTRIRARVLYGHYMSAEEPMTPEVIAAEYNLPLEAVREAIAYCHTNRRKSMRTSAVRNGSWKRRA